MSVYQLGRRVRAGRRLGMRRLGLAEVGVRAPTPTAATVACRQVRAIPS
jgi:hypothetical protein